MTLGIKKEYGQSNSNSSFSGYSLNTDFNTYMKTRVKEKFDDVNGTESLISEFDSLAKTGFDKQQLIDIFESQQDNTDWRIGEALSECFLEDYENAKFYYDYSRDAKNPKSNLTGADLVGFSKAEDHCEFLFGEVKTSADKKTPPQVLYGRSGMTKQLEDIKKVKKIRSALIKWLGFKVYKLDESEPFRIDFMNALEIYISSKCNKFRMVGVLVRDIEPNDNDLKNRYSSLINNINPFCKLDLFGLYLPIKIEKLSTAI
ncbi:hypothetical protein GF327_01660 [Candidatus Woesearchaeota archaeon]|nr:hypothetical protein [Candidatus Woesearchaeota archaeon]